MDEKEKTINVDGIDLPVDTYFDAEEEEDVKRILYDWSCYDKYVSMCIIVTMFAVGNAAELYPGSTLRGCEPLAVRHSLGVFHRSGCAL